MYYQIISQTRNFIYTEDGFTHNLNLLGKTPISFWSEAEAREEIMKMNILETEQYRPMVVLAANLENGIIETINKFYRTYNEIERV